MRPSLDETMLAIAGVLSQRATCGKLAVGCVIVDTHGRILGSGYNGVPRGMTHCTEDACPGAFAPRGSDTCCAVHAEQNALLQVADVDKVESVYVTHAPCLRCTKLLLNTSAKRLVFLDGSQMEISARDLWEQLPGRAWLKYRS